MCSSNDLLLSFGFESLPSECFCSSAVTAAEHLAED
jgi:hypothetical protein